MARLVKLRLRCGVLHSHANLVCLNFLVKICLNLSLAEADFFVECVLMRHGFVLLLGPGFSLFYWICIACAAIDLWYPFEFVV